MLDQDIASLDLDAIAFKLCVEEMLSIEEVDSMVLEYKAFLHALRHHSGSIIPSRRIDVVWHHHILDTEKYMIDCAYLFGRYVHHYPYAGMLGEGDAERHRAAFVRSQAIIRTYLNNQDGACDEKKWE